MRNMQLSLQYYIINIILNEKVITRLWSSHAILLQNLLKPTKDRVKDQTEASNKFLQKKSFLERVWSRKESPGKTDKRLRGKVSSSPTPTSSATEVMSTYDDVSDLMSHPESLADNGENELPEYNCPPPPRPVYTKSPTIANQADLNLVEEYYDDVSACREQRNKNNQVTFPCMYKSYRV